LEQLSFLKSDYDRQSELYKEQISSEKSYLKAQSDYKRTFAVHAGLKKKLELLNINIAAV
jgi:cobalt-zinc-cadmium efflux system membrane fusion protein